MAKRSAGILLYRFKNTHPEFFLVHPGGPFWQKKDLGAWTIPKGEFNEDEEGLTAAKREFYEETGVQISGDFITLSPVKQKAGKLIFAWAIEGDLEPASISSNLFRIEWPPKSGNWQEYPEVDNGGWFEANEARGKINPGQVGFIEELLDKLARKGV